jgi:hypothetical protein
MINRFLENTLKKTAKKYPVVTVTGPRQSGKTTLAKHAFPEYTYISLEDPDNRSFAEEDPRGFLSEYDRYVIFDEIQRVPDLFSYIQTMVDEKPINGRFILTGSQQFLLNEKISQSLAGRSALLRLLPFSLAELTGRKTQNYWKSNAVDRTHPPRKKLYNYIFNGFYPRIYDKHLDPRQWYRDYYETYATRDVRSLINVGDIKSFEQFLRLLAGRSGQLLNLSSLGNDSGVSHTTVKRWLSILEASYLIYILPPYFKNFRKRIIKSPKIYFLDPGLLCFLLRINNPKDIATHPQRGAIFETFIFTELYKSFSHQGLEPPLYFWRDRSGSEIDFLIDRGTKAMPIEAKAGKTVSSDYMKSIISWLTLPGNQQREGVLVYAGDSFSKRQNIQILPWYAVS